VLVRDRAHLLATDRALLLASEAQANRHVLTGLVHAAKGPLNNFNLTLALLSAGVARGDVLAATAEAAARRTRYIDVLQKEAARLASCIDEIHALTVRHEPTEEPIDLAATSVACARVLRHGATMREVNLELDVPEEPVMAIGDPQLVRLALLSFTICVLELTPPGGRVTWRVLRHGDTPAASIIITTSRPVIPRTLATALFRLSCTAESDYSGAIAARLIVEAQGGDVALRETDDGAPGFLLQLRGYA
jgi:signal transduction histidine kinase